MGGKLTSGKGGSVRCQVPGASDEFTSSAGRREPGKVAEKGPMRGGLQGQHPQSSAHVCRSALPCVPSR